MTHYLAIFTGSPEALGNWKALSAEELARRQAEGTKAWQDWVQRHRVAIVMMGGPLGKTKRISASGVADIRNHMTAYTLVQAESHEAAAKLFEEHPHFTIFPGDGVELRTSHCEMFEPTSGSWS
jgi:hypothetical protein